MVLMCCAVFCHGRETWGGECSDGDTDTHREGQGSALAHKRTRRQKTQAKHLKVDTENMKCSLDTASSGRELPQATAKCLTQEQLRTA